MSCSGQHRCQAELPLRYGHHNPSKGVPFSRAWGRAFEVLWGGGITLQRGEVSLCLVLHGDQGEQGNKKGSDCTAAGVPV